MHINTLRAATYRGHRENHLVSSSIQDMALLASALKVGNTTPPTIRHICLLDIVLLMPLQTHFQSRNRTGHKSLHLGPDKMDAWDGAEYVDGLS
jgi:hypothetical protein